MSGIAASKDRSESIVALEACIVPRWPAPANVRAIVTTSGLPGFSDPPFQRCNVGAHCGDRPTDVSANRAALIDWLGLPSAPCWLRQVHGIDVLDLDAVAGQSTEAPEVLADASYSATPGRVCVIQTADCLPVLICSDDGTEVAAAHAGWRGLAGGVIEASIARFRTPASRLHAWLGPAIGPASYEIGDDVRDAFLRSDERAGSAFVATRPHHWFCDLYRLARLRLMTAGVTSVHGGEFDTLTDDRFYSHRRERPTGRFASLIWIDPAAVPSDAARMATDTTTEPSPLSFHASQPDTESNGLFPGLLGAAFDTLPASVRRLHMSQGLRTYRGSARVDRGSHWLSRWCAWLTGLPPAQEGPIEAVLDTTRQREVWTRCFGAHRMRSTLVRAGTLLSERLGLVTFGFGLSVQDGTLHWRVNTVTALGVPLPVQWFKHVQAREYERDGCYCFEVRAALPWIGLLVHYRGSLHVP
ncbi:MAG: peptidoglycan editing factor PgeF [Tahibacter sp.]